MVQCPNCLKATSVAPDVCECGHRFSAAKPRLGKGMIVLIFLAILGVAAGGEYYREEAAFRELQKEVGQSAAAIDEMPDTCRNRVEDLKFRLATARLPLESKRLTALDDEVYGIQRRYCPVR